MPKESSRILRRAPDCGGEREIKQRLRLSGEEERNRTGWKKRKEAVKKKRTLKWQFISAFALLINLPTLKYNQTLRPQCPCKHPSQLLWRNTANCPPIWSSFCHWGKPENVLLKTPQTRKVKIKRDNLSIYSLCILPTCPWTRHYTPNCSMCIGVCMCIWYECKAERLSKSAPMLSWLSPDKIQLSKGQSVCFLLILICVQSPTFSR